MALAMISPSPFTLKFAKNTPSEENVFIYNDARNQADPFKIGGTAVPTSANFGASDKGLNI